MLLMTHQQRSTSTTSSFVGDHATTTSLTSSTVSNTAVHNDYDYDDVVVADTNDDEVISTKLYKPSDIGMNDVLCGRDKSAFNNIGNKRFRITVSLSLGRYLDATTRKAKSKIIKSVAIMIKQNGGRFLQQVTIPSSETGREQIYYMELNEKQSHEKAGHALRDMALARHKPQQSLGSTNKRYSSSTKLTKTTTLRKSMKHQRLQSQPPEEGSSNQVVSAPPYIPSISPSDDHNDLVLLSQMLPQDLDQLHGRLNGYSNFDDDDDDPTDIDDESIFDHLVQLVVRDASFTSVSLEEFSSSSSIVQGGGNHYPEQEPINHDQTTTEQSSSMDPTNRNVNDNHSNDTDHVTEIVSYEPQHQSDRFDSFTIDDRMVSWLIGESDSILDK